MNDYAELRKIHAAKEGLEYAYCDECALYQRYPCDVIQALDELVALRVFFGAIAPNVLQEFDKSV